MNLSSIPFLTTAIAIVISWALFAILSSLVHETIAQILAERGRFMRRYLIKQLQDLPNGINWATLLYLHGSIDLLTRANNKPTNYIAPELFAKTLVDVVGNSFLVQTQLNALKEKGYSNILAQNTGDGFADEKNTYTYTALYNFKAATQLLKPSDLVEFFGQSLKDAEIRAGTNAGEAEVYKHLTFNIETWYKDFSDRLSLWYKKRTRKRLLWIGVLLGIIINVDSVQLFQFYNSNPQSRAAVISYYEQNAPQLNTIADSGADTISNIDTSKLIAKEQLDSLLNFIRGTDSLVKAADLPIGLEYSVLKNYKNRSTEDWFLKLMGIIITGFAASFGAPFWFEVLRKIVR